MQHRLSSLFVAALVASGSTMAYAQAIVQPPAPPAGAAPNVIAPATTASVNSGAIAMKPASPSTLLSVAIPAAPKAKVAPATVGDLKPSIVAKSSAKQDDSKQPKPAAKAGKADDESLVQAKLTADPFAGLVGTPVSDSELNRFVYPEPVEGIYFQEGAPLPECGENPQPTDPCKPVFLNGKRVMLLQLRAGAKGPVQMVVHLESGRFLTQHLMPGPGPGAVVRADGADDGASDTRLAAGRTPAGVGAEQRTGMSGSEQNVDLLSRFARGDVPAGFDAMPMLPEPTRYSLFDVLPQASWDNGAGLRTHLMKVQAHGDAPVAISAALFRHDNVRALALDRETITASEPAYLFILENVSTEE